MSLESAKAFVEKVKKNEDFRKKVNACKGNEARKAFALKEGFDFTVQEIKEVTSELTELSDDDINRIGAGSYCPVDCSHPCEVGIQ